MGKSVVCGAIVVVACFARATTAAACDLPRGQLAPNEARSAAQQLLDSVHVSLSPALTRTAFVLAANAAARVGVDPSDAPEPSDAVTRAAAASCGYPSGTLQYEYSASLPTPLDKRSSAYSIWLASATNDLSLGRVAVAAVGAAFDRYGQLHVVALGGPANDANGADPFAGVTEGSVKQPKPSRGLSVHATYWGGCWTAGGRKTCGWRPWAGAVVTIARNGAVVGRLRTNGTGATSPVFPAGNGTGLSFTISGTLRGKRVTYRKAVPELEKGQILAFNFSVQ